jgi:hypothetical protein
MPRYSQRLVRRIDRVGVAGDPGNPDPRSLLEKQAIDAACPIVACCRNCRHCAAVHAGRATLRIEPLPLQFLGVMAMIEPSRLLRTNGNFKLDHYHRIGEVAQAVVCDAGSLIAAHRIMLAVHGRRTRLATYSTRIPGTPIS